MAAAVSLHEQSLVPREGTFRADLPGALAILCAIAFVTGIFDEDVRETLPTVLWGSLVGTIVFGVLFRYARQTIQHRFVLMRTNDEISVRIEGPSMTEEWGPGWVWHCGVFIENIEAYVAHRDAPVAWVQLRSPNGRTLTIRRALGIHQIVPDWPKASFVSSAECVFSGDPVALYGALASMGPPARDPMAQFRPF